MCGIAGIFTYSEHAPPVDREELACIRDAMARRGPDGSGLWISPTSRIGLAHRRLAIIDLSDAGLQPMASNDGSLQIVFNGEIYNYQALRSELQDKGYCFRTASDTEVLLALYQDCGAEMVNRLRGMFAFAIWDSRASRLFLARDPFGIKPLYYSDNGHVIRFASQVKALRQSRDLSAAPEPAGHVGFFTWGYVPEPYTLFKSIRSLPSGSYMEISANGRIRIQRYFDIATEIEGFSEQESRVQDVHAIVRDSIRDSVSHHLVSDVPVGLFLSSGIDSAAITAMASAISTKQLNALTLGFSEFRGTSGDETLLATTLANELGVAHSNKWISRNHFENVIDDVLESMDQPSIDGINTYLVSEAAAEAGMKVALSGLGGDELFGGYPSFTDIPRSVNSLSRTTKFPWLGRAFRTLSAPVLRQFTSPKYASLLEYGGTFDGAYLLRRGMFMPWELYDVLDPEMAQEGWSELQTLNCIRQSIPATGSDFQKVSALELAWYMRNQLLRDSDWAGMAHSLEIRVPLVDIRLFRSLGALGARPLPPRKRELADACLPSHAMELLTRKKTGFAVPVERWMRDLGMTSRHDRGLRGLAKAVYGRQWPTSPKYAKERVVVFRIGQLGDSLISLPAVFKIRQEHCKASLALLSDRPQKRGMVSALDVMQPLEWFDTFFAYDRSGAMIPRAIEAARLLVRLTRYSPTTVYYLAPKRTPWQRVRDRFFFEHLLRVRAFVQSADTPIVANDPDGHLPRVDAEWRRLFRVVASTPDESFRLEVPAGERIQARALIGQHRLSGRRNLIAIGPGSKMPSKIWPSNNFAALGTRMLGAFPQTHLLVLGGPEDRDLGDRLCATWGGRSTNFAGSLTVYGSAAVLEYCSMYIGNDTGTMHLAAMVGVPCVAIFSARDFPGLWEPYGSGHSVLRKSVKCAGCMLEVCKEEQNRCLTMITVEEVFSAAAGRLEGRQSDSQSAPTPAPLVL